MKWNDDGIRHLRAAVLLQACKDYISMKKWGPADPKLEAFFRGEGTWWVWAGNIDPDYVLKRMDKIRIGGWT